MKKVFSCMLLLFISMILCLPVYAVSENPTLIDDAGYLIQPELAKLSEELEQIREKYNFEVAIYTESEMSGITAEEAADDIYDYNGYGAGKNNDGIMLYICRGTREYHFTTHGEGLKVFNSNGLKYLESMVLPHFENDDYYEAFETYIQISDELLKMASEGNPYNEKHYSTKYIVGVIVLCLLAPLLIAFIMMKKKLKKMKTAVEDNYAADYMKPGSMNLSISKDLFLYSRITKTEKSKSGSSTHTSSSGKTHGGRGGSF